MLKSYQSEEFGQDFLCAAADQLSKQSFIIGLLKSVKSVVFQLFLHSSCTFKAKSVT